MGNLPFVQTIVSDEECHLKTEIPEIGYIVMRGDTGDIYINITGNNGSIDDWVKVKDIGKNSILIFDPICGCRNPFPKTAFQYRRWYIDRTWLFNPYTGAPRQLDQIVKDRFGLLIKPNE